MHCSGFIHIPPNREHHGAEARRTPDKIGDGLCQKHAVYPKPKQLRQKDGERHDDDGLAQQREKDRLFGFSKAGKDRLSRKLQRHHKKAKEIDVHGRHAQRNQFRFAVEQVDKGLWEKCRHSQMTVVYRMQVMDMKRMDSFTRSILPAP